MCHKVAALHIKRPSELYLAKRLSVEVWVKYNELARLQHAQIVLQAHSEVTATDLTELPPTCSAFSEWSYKVN